MSEYLSGRKRNLNIGINSYTENDLVLNVIGNTNISGITTNEGNMYINGDLYIKGDLIAKIPQKLSDLLDVDITDSLDKYVLMYDSVSQKWKNVNPDEVLISATTDQTSGYIGIPSTFEDQLNIDLNNKIDLDAGNF
jgi:hypothetical protein